MSYHPEQRFTTSMTTFRRHVMLPDEVTGSVDVRDGKRVDPHDVVAKGVHPSRHVIVEGAHFFGLKKPESLKALMLVEVGDAVEVRQPIAGKSRDRGKRLFSPVNGLIQQVVDGRIIIREMPELMKLEAGAKGRVVEVRPGRGVVIETTGALIQGVWGNNRRAIANLQFEPEIGLENLTTDDMGIERLGGIFLTPRSLKAASLATMQEQRFSGIIAPSMDADLREQALKVDGAVLLTEGFGSAQMSHLVYSLLSEFENRQVTLDAVTPTRWDTRRPEIIIPQAAEERPPGTNPMLTLRPGMNVRLVRAPYAGLAGKVVDLPKTPCLLDNGLRVPCAQVELVAGETVTVPLANLEYYGK
jgi:hypothetical protein